MYEPLAVNLQQFWTSYTTGIRKVNPGVRMQCALVPGEVWVRVDDRWLLAAYWDDSATKVMAYSSETFDREMMTPDPLWSAAHEGKIIATYIYDPDHDGDPAPPSRRRRLARH